MKDSQDTDKIEEKIAAKAADQPAERPPEDVAVLYSWANLHGARYRDFSDSRREYRAQLRQRAAEQAGESPAPSRTEAPITPASVAPVEQSTETEIRREQPHLPVPSLEEVRPNRSRRASDRPQGYHPDDASGVRDIFRGPEEPAQAEHEVRPRPAPYPPASETMYSDRPSAVIYKDASSHASTRRGEQQFSERRAVRPEAAPSTDPGFAARRDDLAEQAATAARYQTGSSIAPEAAPPRGRRAQDDFDYRQAVPLKDQVRRAAFEPESLHPPAPRSPYAADPAGPAWLYAPMTAQQLPPRPQPPQPQHVQPSVGETLQNSRERVASRWYALKGVFEQPGQELPEASPVRQKETRTPLLAVFSLAGGVGKTSLVATVGRALSSLGEKVLLTDTTSHGLLPFYFGASELRPDTVRTFSPPSGSTDAPIYLVSHDVEQKVCDEATQQQLSGEVINNSRGTQRILLDLTANSGWLVRQLARMEPTILVPLAPDMNSVISLQAVERYFHGITGYDGRPLQPFFLLNQFDSSLPLHLDVREVLRRQLGDRLLPFIIRRDPVVSEALAEGMTVVDYAPDAPVTEDYMNLAAWLRGVAAPAATGFRNVRWSER